MLLTHLLLAQLALLAHLTSYEFPTVGAAFAGGLVVGAAAMGVWVRQYGRR